ncbi:hypothetical protein G4228_000935 [Cervus hanglu yarkandensis]|nr:hypothetical protein G4228_000935 [Cervus hanglu yarkandensis]
MGVAVVSHVRALPQASSKSVGLQGDSSLQVEISDAVSERSGTSFRSCLPHFAQTEFSVVRQHEEFIWLHGAYEGEVSQLCPPLSRSPSPSTVRLFEASKEKLQKLDEEDRSITRQEFAKMKQELEAQQGTCELPAVLCGEYLAIFKKTVTIHEVSLQQLAAHPTLCRDHNFFVFLEYSQDCLSDSARQAKPRAPRALPLHGPPCQGRHCSPLQSSWTSNPMDLPSMRTSLSWASWSSNTPK